MSSGSNGDGVKRSRRALLAGATGAAGVLAVKSLASTPAAEATQGQPVIAGFNNTEDAPTVLTNTNPVSTDAFIANAAGAGTGVVGTSSGAWGVRGEGGGSLQGGGGGVYALGKARSNGLEAHGGPSGGLGVYAWGAGVYAAVKARAATSGDFSYFEPDESGVVGIGGDNDGPGIVGSGGGSGGTGVVGVGALGYADLGPAGSGVVGIGGGTGPGVQGVGGVNDAAGVSGYGNGLGAGVIGHGGPSGGPGVRGEGAGDEAGVSGQGAGTGAGVVGFGGGSSGPGVQGFSFGLGPGVLAQNTAGNALQVEGKAAFSRSGSATVPAGMKKTTVTDVVLSAQSLILATAQSVAGAVKAAVPDVPGGRFTIYLTKAATTAVPVAWFVLN